MSRIVPVYERCSSFKHQNIDRTALMRINALMEAPGVKKILCVASSRYRFFYIIIIIIIILMYLFQLDSPERKREMKN